MTYNKPEVQTLGEATMVIESFPHLKNVQPVADGIPPKLSVNPAYDLDE